MSDLCLIVEASYPFVKNDTGDRIEALLNAQSNRSIHLLAIVPQDAPQPCYSLPPHVTLSTLSLTLPRGKDLSETALRRLMNVLFDPLTQIVAGQAGLSQWRRMTEMLAPHASAGSAALLESEEAWRLLTEIAETSFAGSPLRDFAASWRGLFGALAAIATAELPKANAYHAIGSEFAGLLAARAKIELNKPVFLSEWQDSLMQRRLELVAMDWPEPGAAWSIDASHLGLRDFWHHAFASMARISRQAADRVIVSFEEDRQRMTREGVPLEKIQRIPQGIELVRFGNITREAHANSTIALIAPVEPSSDIKCFIHAISLLRSQLPELRAMIFGEAANAPYAAECKHLVEYYAMSEQLIRHDLAALEEHLPQIDIIVSTHIAEPPSMPFLIAGAAKIPMIATDHRISREWLGEGGLIVPPANPKALAAAMHQLLAHRARYAQTAEALHRQVTQQHDLAQEQAAYQQLYHTVTER